MKFFLIIILTSVFVILVMFLLNVTSFDGITKIDDKNRDLKNKISLKIEDKNK